MKKPISLLLCFSLLSCLSLKLYSQSAENELDQVKLVQQLLGTWQIPIRGDSVMQYTAFPIVGGGYYGKLEYKSGDNVYAVGGFVMGFSPDHKTLEMTVVWPGGNVTHDIGRFVTEKKMVLERFNLDSPTHAIGIWEYEITSPNTMTGVGYGRGQNITWEHGEGMKFSYTKID